MRILWIIGLEYEFGLRHGANLRFFNLSRELITMGHEVYFITHRRSTDDTVQKQAYVRQLIDGRVISGHLEVAYAPPARVRRLGQLAVYPGLVNRILRRHQEPVRALVEEFVVRTGIDLCIVSSRQLLFLVPSIGRLRPVFIDWIDSFVLFLLRETALTLNQRKFTPMGSVLRSLVEAYADESYYGKRCLVNLTASPADQRCLDLVNRRPDRNRVLLNGVAIRGARVDIAPIPNRLIFSGNMSFPPNCDGAIWFIDHVLPLVLLRQPDIVLVVAGANPPAELLRRSSRNVRITGFVEDMEREIAESMLYVAPLVSGSGFKNKVVEAMGANRYVVATSRAVEFLDPVVRSQLLVADTQEGMAKHILTYLANPALYEPALRTARQILNQEFAWQRRAQELQSIAREHVGAPEAAPAVQNDPRRARVPRVASGLPAAGPRGTKACSSPWRD